MLLVWRMKREPGTSDEEWVDQLADRKLTAEERMQQADNMKGFVTIAQLYKAKKIWNTSAHAAEIRLMNGELP